VADDSSEVVKETTEVLGVNNLKTVGEATAFLSNMMLANLVTQQQNNATLANTILGKVCEMIITTQPTEGAVDVAGLQGLAKMVGNIPPVTP
jgi:hypothetical protein